MLKIGIIGLGDIAKKAYLPVISHISDVELHLFTRNQAYLKEIGTAYRFSHLHATLDSLISSGIKGAFVHSSTESHEEIVEMLLLNGIHVYVDKPITYHYESAQRLASLAEEKSLLLMVGFNRRYAPAHRALKEKEVLPNMVIMTKNRPNQPDKIRRFVFDDFIHVIDTVRYLFPHPIERIMVNGKVENNLLYHVVVQFISQQGTAMAIMNRHSGVLEEKIEVFTNHEKRTVYNVTDTVVQRDNKKHFLGNNDWEPTLQKRGFEAIVQDFLAAVGNEQSPMITMADALKTHEICETIVQALEDKKDAGTLISL